MPQLDFSTFATQAFWMVFSFCLLWIFISIFITPKIADILEQRKRKIDDYINKAEKLNNQAQASLQKYQSALEDAKNKAAADIANNQKELSAYLANAEKEMSERLNKKVADSEFLLAKEKKETLLQVQSISQNLAFEIVQKLGFKDITKDDIVKSANEGTN